MDYFLFNKASDYGRGYLEKVRYQGGALSLCSGESEQPGIFLSRILDSREAFTKWQRIHMDFELEDNTAVELLVYSTDGERGREQAESVLKSPELDGNQKLNRLEPYLRKKIRNQGDSLLNQIEGRYLWLAAILWGSAGESPRIRLIQIFFPWETLVSWLPEIYAGGDGGFLERYLAIFQTVCQEMDREIRSFPARMDFGTADEETLIWLAGWLSMDNLHSWRPERLKRYLQNGAAVYRDRGTKRGIKRLVWYYTGFQPYLIEPSGEPGVFLLLIPQAAVPDYQEYQALLRVIREGKPAHMEARVVVLKNQVSLGDGTYLGVNSVVSGHQPAVLKQMSRTGYDILGG